MRVCWQSWTGDTTENLSLTFSDEAIVAESVIVSERFTAKYRVACDISWVTRKLDMEVQEGQKTEHLLLESNGKGVWASGSIPAPNLCGATDIDISATPFTNTLPIRRLKLRENQTRTIQVVYVAVPELEVSLKTQRYTCIAPYERYLFEQPSDGFSREIQVDKDGLVTEYPGLFKRVICKKHLLSTAINF